MPRRCTPGPARPRSRHSGAGLIEVLVAVLIVSIGFIGVAALQTRSLASNTGAMMRSMATGLSYSILDAMRVDRDAAINEHAYNQRVNVGGHCPTQEGTLAERQLRAWCESVRGEIGPAATGEVHCQVDGVCAVTITYPGHGIHAGNDQDHQVSIVQTRARL